MTPTWRRLIGRTVSVGIVLAVIGYVLAQAFLMSHRFYSGGAYNQDNERVLWQTPLTMALIGMLFSGGVECLVTLFRKPAALTAKLPPDPE